MTLTESIKPISAILALIISASVVFGLVDDRYALAEEVQQTFQQQQKEFNEYRVQQLDNKVFELNFKRQQQGKLSPLDGALLERYKDQIQTIRSQ